jgi:probable rRNA maturation factor
LTPITFISVPEGAALEVPGNRECTSSHPLFYFASVMISFHKADVSYRLLHKDGISKWLTNVAGKEKFKIADLNIILCSDEYLYKMNVSYLKHRTYTDIITFDYSQGVSPISGELYISIERVLDNALKLALNSKDELHRVMVHGLLHLCGYSDKSAASKAEMRKREELYLSLRKFL